jgi:hypothetical protein
VPASTRSRTFAVTIAAMLARTAGLTMGRWRMLASRSTCALFWSPTHCPVPFLEKRPKRSEMVRPRKRRVIVTATCARASSPGFDFFSISSAFASRYWSSGFCSFIVSCPGNEKAAL